MNKPPRIWFPTYIGEFFTVTATMTGHEIGAYQLIIAKLWKDGGAIPADDKSLAKLTKATPRQWREIKEALWPHFEIKGGLLTHPETTAEIRKAIANGEKRRAAGIASGASRRANTCSTDDQQTMNKTEAKHEPRASEGEGYPSQGISYGGSDTLGDVPPFRVVGNGK